MPTIILSDIAGTTELGIDTVAYIIVTTLGVLVTSWGVLHKVVDKFLTRLDTQDKLAADEKAKIRAEAAAEKEEIRRAALSQMSEMRASFDRNVEVLQNSQAEERLKRESVFAENYSALSAAVLEVSEQGVSSFNSLSTDIGEITERIDNPTEGVKAKLDNIKTMLTGMEKHIDNVPHILGTLEVIQNILKATPPIITITALSEPRPLSEVGSEGLDKAFES